MRAYNQVIFGVRGGSPGGELNHTRTLPVGDDLAIAVGSEKASSYNQDAALRTGLKIALVPWRMSARGIFRAHERAAGADLELRDGRAERAEPLAYGRTASRTGIDLFVRICSSILAASILAAHRAPLLPLPWFPT